jgi:hypothetical protein
MQADRAGPPSACEGIFAPRALAAFVKRPQAALLKSALGIFYKTPFYRGQKHVLSIFTKE